MQLLDVRVPTTDGRVLILPRYTQPDADQKLLLSQLKLRLPEQPPPRIQSQPVAVARHYVAAAHSFFISDLGGGSGFEPPPGAYWRH